MVTVKYVILSFSDLKLNPFDIPKLRGYFTRRFPDEHLFHNHLPDGSQSYRYPQIQYRIIDSHPALLGIGDGIDAMKRVFMLVDELSIGNTLHISSEKTVNIYEADFGQCRQFHTYSFISPWMALNQENYQEFMRQDALRQKQRLKQILKGNLLTISKGFGYSIPNFDSVELDSWFHPVARNFHNIPMQCFTGEFTVNFQIPDFLGLGKQCARGFGVVKKQED